MAGHGHTPFWRNDPVTTARNISQDARRPSSSGQNNLPNNEASATGEGPGYAFGYDTSVLHSGNTLLDSNENDLMSTFFDDPNSFTGFEFGMDNNKDNPFNFQFETLGDSSQNPFNLSYLPTSNQMTAFSIPNNQQAQSQPSFNGVGANDDASAASYLMNMSSQHPDSNTSIAPSWTGMSQAHAGFMIPSDDHSPTADGSYGGLRQVPYPGEMTSRQAIPNGAYGPASSGTSNPALNATDYRSFYNEGNNTSQVRTVNGGQSRPPLPYSFGSDRNFSSQGYQGMGSSLERDKVYNLLPMIQKVGQPAVGQDSGMHGMTYGRQAGDDGAANANHMTSPSALQTSNLGQWVDEKRRKSGYMIESGDGDEEPQSAARKRRLSQDGGFEARRGSTAARDDGYDGDTPVKRHRKSVGGRQASSTPGSPASSAGGEGGSKKKSRENKARPNLSESQKRENHIISEQKRRNVIKQAFNDLNRMVPTLQNGKSGLSKAEVLKEVVTFVEATVQGNKIMAELLEGRRTGP